ncbi:MAG: hypothetical protein ABI295_09605, partial [Xanthomarina sp.]
MAPIKFEENMKEKLEKRTLQPSTQAWDKLSGKLQADTKKASSKTIWWLGIAASFVGILFMVNVFFTTSRSGNNTPVLVDTESKALEDIQNKNEGNPHETFIVNEESIVENESSLEDTIKLPKTKKEAGVLKRPSDKIVSIAEVEPYNKEEEIENNVIFKTGSPDIELAQINSQEKTRRTETDIDSLLKRAQQNLAKNRNYKNKNIDAL